jgi:hypothetical protein
VTARVADVVRSNPHFHERRCGFPKAKTEAVTW